MSKKTLQSLRGDLTAFLRYCRKAKLTTFRPEEVEIPAGARYKGKKVLQPDALLKLFSELNVLDVSTMDFAQNLLALKCS